MAVWQWSKLPASNANADPTINFAEGQSPSSLNDSCRALMTAVAQDRDDKSGVITAGGTATVMTFTSNSSISATPDDGHRITMRMPFANGLAPTMQADGGNTYPIQSAAGVAIGTGIMVSGGIYDMSFNLAALAWIVVAAFIGNVQGPATSVAGHIATYADVTGKVLADGGALGPLAQQQTILAANLAPDAAPLPPVSSQPTDNLQMQNDGTNPTRDAAIFHGRCRDDADVTNLSLLAHMVKRLDTAWAQGGASGSPVGGCDTGTKGASQTWHAYVIGKLAQAPSQYARSGTTVTITFPGNHGLGAGGTARVIGINSIGGAQGFDGDFAIASVPTSSTLTYTSPISGTIGTTAVPAGTTVDGFDCLFSQSYPSPTMPSGWTVKQCVGSILTDGSSNILAFTQIGDEFILGTMIVTTIPSIATGPRSLNAIGVPLGVAAKAQIRVALGSAGAGVEAYALITSPSETDQGVTANTASLSSGVIGTATTQQGIGTFDVITNTSAQVGVRGSTSPGMIINLVSWRDPRRRMF